jgi:thiol-disulfide isomerase/thioredoxin
MKYVILIICLCFSKAITAQDYPEVLPDFKIFKVNGDAFTTDDVQKETYSFFIYFNPECGHCETAFKTLNIKAKKIGEANVMVYPVSANTEEKTIKFFEDLAPDIKALENITILRDDDFKFADALFVGGYPTSYLYDNNNKLVKVYNGTSETVLFLNDLK